jgi:hypothetical protein
MWCRRYPPEDFVRCALYAYHGGYFNATHPGLVAKVTQKRNTLLDTIPGSFTPNHYAPFVTT